MYLLEPPPTTDRGQVDFSEAINPKIFIFMNKQCKNALTSKYSKNLPACIQKKSTSMLVVDSHLLFVPRKLFELGFG